MKIHDNQHFWTCIAQCKNPYREFAYCERCNTYMESGNGWKMGKKLFIALALSLKEEGNPMYEPDSNILLEFQQRR